MPFHLLGHFFSVFFLSSILPEIIQESPGWFLTCVAIMCTHSLLVGSDAAHTHIVLNLCLPSSHSPFLAQPILTYPAFVYFMASLITRKWTRIYAIMFSEWFVSTSYFQALYQSLYHFWLNSNCVCIIYHLLLLSLTSGHTLNVFIPVLFLKARDIHSDSAWLLSFLNHHGHQNLWWNSWLSDDYAT